MTSGYVYLCCNKTPIEGHDESCPGYGKPSSFSVASRSRDARLIAATPLPAGKVVSMCEFQGQVLVACESGVFRLVDGKLVPIEFVTGEGK